MINNLQVMESVVSYLDFEINCDYNIEKEKNKDRKRKFALKKKTPWGQTINSKTTIGKIAKYSDYGVWVSSGIIFPPACYLIFDLWMTSVCLVSKDTVLMQICLERIKHSLSLMAIPSFTCIFSYIISDLKKSLMDEEKMIKEEAKYIEEKRVQNQMAFDAIQYAYAKSYGNSEIRTVLKDFLEKVNLTKNTELYNVNLVTLLANATNYPNKETFHELSTFLKESMEPVPTDRKNMASQEFLQNRFVREFVKRY